MQFSTLFTTITLLAFASASANNCQYAAGSHGRCVQGNKLHCVDSGICSTGQAETSDEYTIDANEETCLDKEVDDVCNFIACCS
ncbi:unnamed protein product [Diplocarpon coronariae]